MLHERIAELPQGERAEISDVADAVDALLDRSVGAEEYVIRAAADGVDPDPLIDLSQIDFDSLAAQFAGRKRTETERYAALLKQRAVSAASYGDDGTSVYDVHAEVLVADRTVAGVSVEEITSAVVERMRVDSEFAALGARELRGVTPTFARSIEELIAGIEDESVEFKSTARWDLREQRRNKAMEDAVVKTVAAFLNTDGGTLLVGVADDGALVGLTHDYQHVQPHNGDGFINWLSTLLTNALGAAAAMRVRARIVKHYGVDLCRVDVPASSRPTWTKTSTKPRVFFVRMNNSTRVMPDDELPAYLAACRPSVRGLTVAGSAAGSRL